jgi:hypothetical protein
MHSTMGLYCRNRKHAQRYVPKWDRPFWRPLICVLSFRHHRKHNLRSPLLLSNSPWRKGQGWPPKRLLSMQQIGTELFACEPRHNSVWIWGGLISLWLYKESNKLLDWKNVFTLHIPPWGKHTYNFVALTSLTHPRKILLVVLQTGKYEIQRLISTPM